MAAPVVCGGQSQDEQQKGLCFLNKGLLNSRQDVGGWMEWGVLPWGVSLLAVTAAKATGIFSSLPTHAAPKQLLSC